MDARRIAGFHCDMPLLLAVRMLIEQERCERGVEILDAIWPDAVGTRRVAAQIENLVVRALLERAASGAADRAFADRVIASCQTATRPSPTRPATVEGLSERELEVLRPVASGASNHDAARKLFIAASTVKKHLDNIYGKLAVGDRVEAIARARDLKLL